MTSRTKVVRSVVTLHTSLWSQQSGRTYIRSRPNAGKVPLQNEIRRRQRLQAGELNLEIGDAVAVDVAFDDGLVVGGTGGVALEPAQFARHAVKLIAFDSEEAEGGSAGTHAIGVDGRKSMSSLKWMKSLMTSRAAPLPISTTLLKSKSSPPAPPIVVFLAEASGEPVVAHAAVE